MRDFLESGAGKASAAGLLVLGLIAAVLMFRNAFGTSAEVADANTRWFIDASNGKPFQHEMEAGDSIPLKAPSGQMAGYPAELCWWTKDGKVREQPFPVLLNTSLGKPEPTFCPDCGHLVVGHNPRPGPESKPPPTKETYKERPSRGGR